MENVQEGVEVAAETLIDTEDIENTEVEVENVDTIDGDLDQEKGVIEGIDVQGTIAIAAKGKIAEVQEAVLQDPEVKRGLVEIDTAIDIEKDSSQDFINWTHISKDRSTS